MAGGRTGGRAKRERRAPNRLNLRLRAFLPAGLPDRRPALAAVCLVLFATPTLAQTDSTLAAAVRLAQDGQGDSARAVVRRVLVVTTPTDSLYPQTLYTMGLVSQSVDEMRRNYQRISVEYATSPWADDAVLRLAMLDYAAGDPNGTARHVERIR